MIHSFLQSTTLYSAKFGLICHFKMKQKGMQAKLFGSIARNLFFMLMFSAGKMILIELVMKACSDTINSMQRSIKSFTTHLE